jgi:hypothetical protein
MSNIMPRSKLRTAATPLQGKLPGSATMPPVTTRLVVVIVRENGIADVPLTICCDGLNAQDDAEGSPEHDMLVIPEKLFIGVTMIVKFALPPADTEAEELPPAPIPIWKSGAA